MAFEHFEDGTGNDSHESAVQAEQEYNAMYEEWGNTPCGICQEGPIVQVVTLTCAGSHGYHHECIANWILQGKRTCPLCREECIPNTMRQIWVIDNEIGNAMSATTGSFTVDFGSLTLNDPQFCERMSSDTGYEIRATEIGGIAWPDDYEAYVISDMSFNAGSVYNNPAVPLTFYKN
jgi:hypothetical protein